jgi:hypothetical protein
MLLNNGPTWVLIGRDAKFCLDANPCVSTDWQIKVCFNRIRTIRTGRGSSVGIGRYSDLLLARRPRGRGSIPDGGKNFHFSMSSRLALGPTQPPIQWVPGALSPGVKRPGREADHLPPTSAEVKKTWVYTSSPPYIFMLSTGTTLPYLCHRPDCRVASSFFQYGGRFGSQHTSYINFRQFTCCSF